MATDTMRDDTAFVQAALDRKRALAVGEYCIRAPLVICAKHNTLWSGFPAPESDAWYIRIVDEPQRIPVWCTQCADERPPLKAEVRTRGGTYEPLTPLSDA